MKSAKEYWKERFGEDPQTDAEKLAVAMMQEYAKFMQIEARNEPPLPRPIPKERPQPDTITVKALRNKVSGRWYYYNEWRDVYIESELPSLFVDGNVSSNTPGDAETIILECRIIKTEKP